MDLATIEVWNHPYSIPHTPEYMYSLWNHVPRAHFLWKIPFWHPFMQIWQPWWSNLATLLAWQLCICLHLVPRPQKHGSRLQKHFSRSISSKVIAFLEPVYMDLATLMVKLATLLVWQLWICVQLVPWPKKHGSRYQKHFSGSISSKVMTIMVKFL